MKTEFVPGAEIEVAHPFVLEEIDLWDGEGPCKQMSWRPGTRMEPVPPDTAEAVADGIGTQIITIVSVHKPGRFPTRVFFTRRWRDPKGREFGKTKLCMATQGSLRIRCRGFRHPYELKDNAIPAPSEARS